MERKIDAKYLIIFILFCKTCRNMIFPRVTQSRVLRHKRVSILWIEMVPTYIKYSLMTWKIYGPVVTKRHMENTRSGIWFTLYTLRYCDITVSIQMWMWKWSNPSPVTEMVGATSNMWSCSFLRDGRMVRVRFL